MKNERGVNLMTLIKRFGTDEAARGYLEALRWPSGAACPRCGGADPYKLTARKDSKRPGRPGLYKCRACKRQFTVTVGTIFEDSHIPLSIWVIALHLMAASKKGMSAHQLHRMLGITYKSAWFMAHRIRWAMTQEPFSGKLGGIVEVDETYLGKGDAKAGRRFANNTVKIPVFTLVERGGRARSFIPPRVTAANIDAILKEHVSPDATIMTDEATWYKHPSLTFPGAHHTVNHHKGEYARRDASGHIHTNTVEGFFSLLKRGIIGTFHHVSAHHLHRYLAEFDFRYNRRDVTDGERAAMSVKAAEGKRLMLRG
jgi:transposase-like protein